MVLKGKWTHSVLVVDDDLDVLDLFKVHLEDLSCLVYTSKDGSDALNFLVNNKVDCIITDISMPNMSGPELIHQLKERNDETPFFFITGYHDYSREELNRFKPRAIIFKPFDFEEAAILIKNHLLRIN